LHSDPNLLHDAGSDAMLPDGLLPDGLLPDGLLPDGLLPDGLLPHAILRSLPDRLREQLRWLQLRDRLQ
jgi:hypothetical protein